MKICRRRFLVAALCSLLLPVSAIAQVPQLINYQGRITVGNANFDRNGLFKFALVDASGTNAYWRNDGTHPEGTEPDAAVSLPVVKGKPPSARLDRWHPASAAPSSNPQYAVVILERFIEPKDEVARPACLMRQREHARSGLPRLSNRVTPPSPAKKSPISQTPTLKALYSAVP